MSLLALKARRSALGALHAVVLVLRGWLIAVALLVACVVLPGCSDDDGEAAGTGGSPGTGGATGSGGDSATGGSSGAGAGGAGAGGVASGSGGSVADASAGGADPVDASDVREGGDMPDAAGTDGGGSGGAQGSGGSDGSGGVQGTGGAGTGGAPPLALSVTLNPDRVRPGEGALATLTVTNPGASIVSGAVLRARFPVAGVSPSLNQSLLSGGGTCPAGYCDPGELVTWNLPPLAPGKGVIFTMPMVVASAATAGTTIEVQGEVQSGGSQVLSSASVTVDTDNALSLALDEDSDPVRPGGTLTYTLTYGNRSGASVTGSTLRLPLPAGVTFAAASGGGTFGNGVVEWSLGTLRATESGRRQVTVSVPGSLAAGTILVVSGAEISGTSATTGPESARAASATRVEAPPALGLAIEMDRDPVRPGEGIRAKLTVTNRTDSLVLGTTVVARFPIAGVANSLNESLLTGGGSCPSGYCDRFELVRWDVGTVSAGSGVTLMLPMVIATGATSGTTVTLDATVSADGTTQVATSHTAVVDADTALALDLGEDRDPVTAGGALTYTLTYGNRSAASIAGATLRLPLPAGVTFLSATGGGSLSGGAVQWALGTLQATESGRRQVMVTAGAGLSSGSILTVDAAELSGTSATSGNEHARATSATRVQSAPELGLAVEMDPDPVRRGEGVRAKITVTNRSENLVLGTTVVARFPIEDVGNSLNATLVTGGGACPSGYCDRYELVRWTVGTLGAGAGVTLMLPMVIANDATSGNLVTLDVLAAADGVAQVAASHAVVVDSDNALSVALTEDRDPVAPGAALGYTLTYGNRSAASITGAALRLPVPSGVSVVSATGGGTVAGGVVEWSLGTVPAGAVGRRQVAATVGASVPSGTVLSVDAAELSGSSATTGREFARATAATRVATGSPLQLALAVSPNPIAAAQTLTATLTLTNTGASDSLGTVLLARFPTDRVNGTLNQNQLSGGGTCPSGYCDGFELVTWSLGTVAAGASRTVTMPMIVTAGTASGTLIAADAVVRSDAGDFAVVGDTAAVGSGSF